jgi:hypothetical protein
LPNLKAKRTVKRRKAVLHFNLLFTALGLYFGIALCSILFQALRWPEFLNDLWVISTFLTVNKYLGDERIGTRVISVFNSVHSAVHKFLPHCASKPEKEATITKVGSRNRTTSNRQHLRYQQVTEE